MILRNLAQLLVQHVEDFTTSMELTGSNWVRLQPAAVSTLKHPLLKGLIRIP